MELEFDKEMDAILRRARDGRGVLVGDEPPEKTKHIDADSIAAFVENALPAKTRTLYMEHFADCDRCRRILSQSMLFASEADVKAASVVSEPVLAVAIPWYQKLFRTPNLAMAMGLLVLLFGGVLTVLIIRERQNDANSSVAQITENERPAGGPSASEPSANAAAAPLLQDQMDQIASANKAANAAATANVAASSPLATPKPEDLRAVTLPAERPDTGLVGGVSASTPASGGESPRAEVETRPMPKGAAPPPPVLSDEVLAERSQKEEEKSKDDDRADAMKKSATRTVTRDLPAAPAKGGPVRSGPTNIQQNQIQNQTFDMPVTRSVGGKTFNNRNGAWYDSAYKNQATVNFRRGTDEYKKLDSGLRSIADNLGGTVVLVWKGRAYRIQ